jgi:hypothetical protein
VNATARRAVGAHPVRMLTGLGHLPLAVGTAFLCSGCRVVWSANWSGGAAVSAIVRGVIGAPPVRMLTGLGHFLLAVGVAPAVRGVAWSGRVVPQ